MYKCRYCEKDFSKESTLAVHLCEPKRRWQQEKETGVQLGLRAYLRFYEITQGSAKLKSYDDFFDETIIAGCLYTCNYGDSCGAATTITAPNVSKTSVTPFQVTYS